jgi:hypothetical protein
MARSTAICGVGRIFSSPETIEKCDSRTRRTTSSSISEKEGNWNVGAIFGLIGPRPLLISLADPNPHFGETRTVSFNGPLASKASGNGQRRRRTGGN